MTIIWIQHMIETAHLGVRTMERYESTYSEVCEYMLEEVRFIQYIGKHA